LVRIGVNFVGLSRSDQRELERFVFEQLGLEARSKRHLRGLLYRDSPQERRGARRVQVVQEGDLELRLFATQRRLPLEVQAQIVSGKSGPAPRGLTLVNISSSGCAFLCTKADALPPGAMLDLELNGSDFDLRVRGRVVYALLQK